MAVTWSLCARHSPGLNSLGDRDLGTLASSHSPLMETLTVKGHLVWDGGIKRAALPSTGKSQLEQCIDGAVMFSLLLWTKAIVSLDFF